MLFDVPTPDVQKRMLNLMFRHHKDYHNNM